ncbi:MAG: hypothetical protein K8S94_06030 [Planctomycetia bacterium]|nr:hypothetical protein [Planctomycetia bacterium]
MIEPRCRRGTSRLVLLLLLSTGLIVRAAIAAETPRPTAELAAREAELLERYRELERSFLRLADLLAATDPRRAAVLRSTFERAREEQVGDRVAAIVTLLEQGQLLKAGTSQQDAIAQLQSLLQLLESGAGESRIADTKKEVRAFIGRVTKLIARQKDIEGSTEAGDEEAKLAERQRAAADEASALGAEIDAFARRIDDREPAADGGKPAESPPDGAPLRPSTPPAEGSDGEPAQPSGDAGEPPDAAGDPAAEGDDDAARARRTRQRLQAAERRMRQARERLDDAKRRDARREQEKAIEELETARAELEEILRQLREQEVERLLVNLESRLRGMLRAERSVLADAEKLAAAAGGQSQRERQLEAARLGREQTAITNEAAKAMTLVRDDGTAVAIPQALEQVHDDSVQAAARLGRGDAGRETIGIVGDIVTGLEEMLAAVEKAQQARQEEEAGGAPGGRAGEPGEQPLVDKLAELKMLRALQMRVNTRTRRFAQVLDDTDHAAQPEVRAVLDRLAERQRAIERAARDIVSGLAE